MNEKFTTAGRTPGVYRHSERFSHPLKKWLACCCIFISLLFAVKINAQISTGCSCSGCVFESATNGNFSAPACAFAYLSDYVFVPCGPPAPFGPLSYTEAAVAANFYNPVWVGADHTGVAGSRYLLVNGQTASGVSMRAWYQNINVLQGRTYCFSAWVMNAASCGPLNTPPTVELRTKGVTGTLLTSATLACGKGWQQICGTFVPTTSGPFEIDIVLKAAGAGGPRENKLAIDDISCVWQGHAPTAAFTYSPNPVNCNETVSFIESETDITSESWDFGDGGTSGSFDPTHVFTHCGTFTVTHHITNLCGEDEHSEEINVYCDYDDNTCCTTCGSEIVVNGHFSSSLCFDSYSSALGSTTPCNVPHFIGNGNFTEASDAGSFNSAWEGFDHTGCTGSRFMLIDGPDATQGDKVAWEQVAPVTPGKTYCFSAWVKNACDICGPDPVMDLIIDNSGTVVTLTSVTLPRGTTSWTKICGTFTAIGATVDLQVLIHGSSISGNDACLDDISLKEVCAGRMMAPKSEAGTAIDVYPVPVKKGSALQLTYTSASDGAVHIQLFDVSGKLIRESTQDVLIGKNQLQVLTEDLEPGVYLISVEGAQGKISSKFLVE